MFPGHSKYSHGDRRLGLESASGRACVASRGCARVLTTSPAPATTVNNTLVKGLRLLELLSRGHGPLGVTELALASGLPKSGAHRLLQALVEEGYVRKQRAGLYETSIKLWQLGSSVLAGFDLRRFAAPMMEELMELTGETVHLSVLDGSDVVYVHKVDSPHTVRAYTQIGGRAPAHCVATGKAMMAFMSAGWLRRATQDLAPATERTITEPQVFLQQALRIRRKGYAVNQGEWRLHVNGLAAPVIDGSSMVAAAIGISGHASRLTALQLEALAEPVLHAAQELSHELGRSMPQAALHSVTRNWALI